MLYKKYEYLKNKGVSVKKPPSLDKIEEIVPKITSKFNEDLETKRIFKKAKEFLTL